MFEKNLPTLFIKIEGNVSTNIAEFKAEIDSYIGSINKELVTDEHFGRAESDIKYCKKTEQELVRVKEAALSQSVDIKTTMDMLGSMGENIRQVRLRLEKLVKREKENRREDIISAASDACLINIKEFNEKLSGFVMPVTNYEMLMRDTIKGKKTIESMEDAVTFLYREYIEINERVFNLMFRNIDYLNRAKDNGYHFLFTDFDQYVHLDNEHVALMINGRINEHKKIEAEKEKTEEERRIKAVEEAKAEAVRLAAVEMAKQKEAVEEATRVAKEQAEVERVKQIAQYKAAVEKDIKETVERAVVEERERASKEREEIGGEYLARLAAEDVCKSDKKENKQRVIFLGDGSDYMSSDWEIDVYFNSTGELTICQSGDDYHHNSIDLTVESLKEILEKCLKNT